MLNYLSNFPFVALRIAHVVLIINTGFGILRLLALVAFAPLGLKGLLLSHVIATTVALIVTTVVMMRKLNYRPHFRINLVEFRKVARYTFQSYFSVLFVMLPIHLLPSIVVGQLGASSSAYYYIVAVIIAALNVIPLATSQSLFAEGVWDGTGLHAHFIKAFKIITALMLPSIIVLVFGGKIILSLFGSEYAHGGYGLLVLLVAASVPKVFSYMLSTVLRIDHRVGIVALIYGLYAAIVIVGSYLGMVAKHGLLSVGWATLIAEIVTMVIFAVAYRLFSQNKKTA